MKPDMFVVAHHKIPSVPYKRTQILGDGSKVSRISNFVVLSFSVITDDLTLSSKDQNVFCIVKCKEDYDHLKLACKPIDLKIMLQCLLHLITYFIEITPNV
jgi:hypothetical protein